MKHLCSGTHHRESRHLVPTAPPVDSKFCSRTVLGGKGSLRRGQKLRAPLPPARRSAARSIATGGSAGNQMQSSFFVLRKTRTRWQ